MDNMLSLKLKLPDQIAREMGDRLRRKRLDRELSQEGLAARSGVSLGTLKRFERTGQASLETVIQIASAMDCEAAFDLIFPKSSVLTVDERNEKPRRQRGTKA